MNDLNAREILENFGFINGTEYGIREDLLMYALRRDADRAYHYLVWDGEQPTIMGIVRRAPISGTLKLLDEPLFTLNVNGLSTSALVHYYQVKEELQSRGLDFEWGWSEL